MAKFLFQKGNKLREGLTPWNKGTEGVCKPNSGSFRVGKSNHNKPHTQETKDKISEQCKNRWTEGCYDNRPPHSKETKEKIRNTLQRGSFIKCAVCNKEIFKSPSCLVAKFCSHKCKGKFYSGEKNLNWKGGKSRGYKTGYYSAKYKNWRRAVFLRDNFTCQECGKKHTYITAHHIKSFADFPNLRFDLNNGKTLCVDCHKETDNYKGKNLKGKKTLCVQQY